MKKFYLTLVALAVSASIKVLAGDPPKTVDIQKLPDGTTITIDGKADEAIWAAATNHADFRLYPAEGAQDQGATDMAGYWKALWSADGIYVLVGVTADDVKSDGTVGADWTQDGIEIYFDMNTDNLHDGGGKGGANPEGHYDFYAKRDSTTPADHSTLVAYMGITGSDAALKLESATSAVGVLEAFIKWSTILDKDGNTYVPSPTKPIGFDICLVDNDNKSDQASPRTRQYWSYNGSGSYEAWYDADSIAVATLIATPPPTGIKYTTSTELSVYPTIAKTTLHFSKPVEGRIVNMVGQEVLKVKGTGANVAGLKQGSYILITNDKEYKRFVIR